MLPIIDQGIINMKKIVFLFLSFLIIGFQIIPSKLMQNTSKSSKKPNNQVIKNNNVWLNIFIHGTVKPPLRIGDISRISKDKLENTFYYYSAAFLRNDPRFYQYQPMQKLGMQPIHIDRKKGNASGAIAEIYDIQYKAEHPEEINYYYTWGWSGLLSLTQREIESKDLLNDLKKLIANYKATGVNPKIRLIGYSHGGNVILNMAIYEEAYDLHIDESIFIGMPVHMDTDCLTNSPMFKKIYQIYSSRDRAQAADVFSTKYFSSHRKFKDRKCCKMPKNKIIQIRLSTTYTMKDPICGEVKKSYNMDPTHIELWSFGWKPNSYRKKFPLTPLPAIAIFPFLASKTKDLGDNIWIEINPYQERMRVTSWCENKKTNTWTLPFMTHAEFDKLSKIALTYIPTITKLENYGCIIKEALIHAIAKQNDRFYTCMNKRRLGNKYSKKGT